MKKLILFLCLWPALAHGTIYYASPTGTDGAVGTIGAPWSLPKACSAAVLVALDTVYLRGGTYTDAYNGTYLFSPQRDSIYYRSYPVAGEWAILQGGVTTGIWATVDANSANHITMDSIEVKYGYSRGCFVSDNGSWWTLRHCLFNLNGQVDDESNNGGGITNTMRNERMLGWLIDSCTFRRALGRGAIHVYSMALTEIRYCHFDTNMTSTGDVWIKNPTDSTYGNNVHHNVVRKIPNGGGLETDGHGMGYSWSYTIRENIFHHNVFVMSNGKSSFMVRAGTGNEYADTHARNYFYNNTMINRNTSDGEGFQNLNGVQPDSSSADSTYIFNNIFFRQTDNFALVSYNANNDNGALGAQPFGDRWYSDYNAFVLKNSADDIVRWYNSATPSDWTLAEWQTNGPSEGAGYVSDANSYAFTDSSIFVNFSAGDYGLRAGHSHYDSLATMGGGPLDTAGVFIPNTWDTYMGALDPGVSDSCPNLIRDSVPNGATITDITPNYVFDIGDTNNDSVYYKLYRDIFNPPTTLRFSGTVATPANNITHTESGLVDRTTYFWRIVYTDTVDQSGGDPEASCVETTSVYNYFVDTVKCPTAANATPANGSTLTAYSVIPTANFQTDDYSNIIVRFYGEALDPTPDILQYTDTLTTDSTGWNAFNWTGLKEDSTYYWRVIATDPDCADTSDVWSFLVDAAGAGAIMELNGTIIEGVRIGKHESDTTGTKTLGWAASGVGDRAGVAPRYHTGPADLVACTVAR